MPLRRIIDQALRVVLFAIAASSMAQTNVALRDELLTLRELDQSGRMLMEETMRQHGHNSPEMRAVWDAQSQIDAKNLIRLKEIISEFGWPGQSLVGRDGSIAAFLILQHADHETQVEYLPIVRVAVEAGELARSAFAMFQDRILVTEGKPQVYGTQLYRNDTTGDLELFPIEDEANVDARRMEIGMIPLAEYVKLVRGDE